ncbi:MAG: 3-hydroxybutyryl-CoA dehydrogenase [Gaiellales bacterium]|nr:3-hydroxybutyryl-CoA dehydrogenase [Gaiellales bacterium]
MIEKVVVVGAGQMGAGIAQVAAAAGMRVTLVDVGEEQLARALAGIGASLAKLASKGQCDDPDAVLARISTSTELDSAADAELAVEAASEDVELKLALFRRLDAALNAGAILASNTSSIPIGRLAAATARPAQVCGMHFMNPPALMPLVELIRGLETSDATVASVRAAAEAMGKTVAEARDVPGFLANRMLLPMLNEAAFCLYEGVGDAEAIDTVMRLGMNHPLGPLALADLIGLDTCLAILEVLHEGFGDPKFRPCPLWRQYVEAGRLGRKAGRGFHAYG